MNILVPPHLANIRIDKALAELSGISRTKIAAAITNSNITINGQIITDLKHKLQENDEAVLDIVPVVRPQIMAADIPINIVFEDDDIIIINKQAGLTVHPGAGNHNDTMVNALVNHYGKSLSSLGGEDRPGIVHRLDRDTTGLIIVAKNDIAHAKLSDDIAHRKIKRIYTAFVWGNISPSSGRIETHIGRSNKDRTRMRITDEPNGKVAITHYNTLRSLGYISIVECTLETGRTHQIRVHLSHLGHSVVGDQTYGQNSRKILQYYGDEKKDVLSNFQRQALHSTKLELAHPITGETIFFEAPLPEDMQKILNILE